MPLVIRNVREDEWDVLMRLLERSFAYSRRFFEKYYPYVFSKQCRDYSSFFVIEKDGKLVSQVSLIKLPAIAYNARFLIGGIGNVATIPEERGKGYMSMLLRHVINIMRRDGYVLSFLIGDRHRYGLFGWELAGLKYVLYITQRAIEKSGVAKAAVEEVEWSDALPIMMKHYESMPLRIERRWECYNGYGIDHMPGLRIWVSEEEGYVIGWGEGRLIMANPAERPSIVEVASLKGSEPGLLASALANSNTREATVYVNSMDYERLGRMLKVASYYITVPEGSFMIVSLKGLLKAFRGLLKRRAEERGILDYEVTLGLSNGDFVDWATIFIRNGDVDVVDNESSRSRVIMDEREGVRFILGGPMVQVPRQLAPLASLMPLPVHIPVLNYV